MGRRVTFYRRDFRRGATRPRIIAALLAGQFICRDNCHGSLGHLSWHHAILLRYRQAPTSTRPISRSLPLYDYRTTYL